MAVFVGRGTEVAALLEGVNRLPAGTGDVHLLAGEPGIGKSRLVTEVASAARERAVKSAWGRCWEAGGAPAFAPWREVFDALGIAFPDPAAIAIDDRAEPRYAHLREAVKTLAAATVGAPLVIVLEDLHAADHSTLLLLELLAGQIRGMPIMVVGTYRDLEVRQVEDVAELVARLARVATVWPLSRLGPEQVTQLVRHLIPDADDELAASVFETTQGNPLFVTEMARDIRTHGQRSGLPLGVREAIRQRLSLVSDDARAALEAASVLGIAHTPAEMARMRPGAVAALEETVAAGVLVARGPRMCFVHALYREALYFGMPPSRRQELHAAAAQAFADLGAPLGLRAHHLLEAGSGHAAEAVDCAVEAAALAVDTFAFEDGMALLERARAAIPVGPLEASLRCRVMTALGEARIRAGDAEGRDVCLEAAELARSLGNAALLAQAGLAYGSVFLMGGVDPVLVSMLSDALDAASRDDAGLRAKLMARLAAARQPSPPAERERDITLALEAVELARRALAGRELLGVLHSASGVFYGAVAPPIRLKISLEAERLAEQLGDTSRLLHARTRVAYDCLELADFAGYDELAHRYDKTATQIGPAAAPWRVPLMRSMMALASDRFEESEHWQREARRIDADSPRARRAEAFHRIGFLRGAERHRELRAAIPELRGLWLSMRYGAILADARVASILARIGADDEVHALVAVMPDEALDEEINASSLGDAMWATNDPALAARVEAILTSYGDRWPPYWFDCEIVDGPNPRVLAYAAGIQGRWQECERTFARALAMVQAIGRRSLGARMCFELGDLMLRAGHAPERARALVARGREEADALGLSELVALIDRRHPLLHRLEETPDTDPTMTLEGEFYTVHFQRRVLRFKATRGMHYIAQLLARPHADIHVLELTGSLEGADRSDAGEIVDATAVRAYRARLDVLRRQLDDAEELADVERAERARSEMERIARELTRSTQKGGKPRRASSAVDRARSAVRRRITDALERIEAEDAPLGALLRRAIRTGNHCAYRPFQ